MELNQLNANELNVLLGNASKAVISKTDLRAVANRKTGMIVNAFKNKPEFGYIVLEEATTSIGTNGFMRTSRRTLTMKEKVSTLTAWLNANTSAGNVDSEGNAKVNGKLVVLEFPENANLPQAIVSAFLSRKGEDGEVLDREEQIKNYIKRAGDEDDAVVLKAGGQRILRFVIFDATGKINDILVAHDNQDEVRVNNANRRKAVAEMAKMKASGEFNYKKATKPQLVAQLVKDLEITKDEIKDLGLVDLRNKYATDVLGIEIEEEEETEA